MTHYSTRRRIYTTDEEFLSGSNSYTGYVIIDGDSYTNLHGEVLSPNNTYATDLLLSDHFRDRQIDDTLSFPYTINDIEIAVNDFITAGIINDRFKKLNDNTTYLYSKLQAPNSRIPASTNTRYIGVSSNDGNLQWFNAFANTISYDSTTNLQSFEHIHNAIGIVSNFTDESFTIFAVTSSNFISLTANSTNVNIIEDSNYIEQYNNDLTYSKIESIDYHENILYVCDSGRKSIYKYDIGSYLTGDNTYNNRRILLDTFGSYSDANDQSKFKNPTMIAAKTGEIAIYDAGAYTLKIFDNSFNYITTIKVANFKRTPVLALKYNKFYNELWLITMDAGVLKLHTVDSSYNLVETRDIFETLSTTDFIRGISFSENSTDYWYLITNEHIYKKLIHKPYKAIGTLDSGKLFSIYNYKWNNAIFSYNSANILWNSGSDKSSNFGNFIGLNCQFINSDYDRLFLFKYGRFFVFDEPNNFINVLNFYNKENYNIEDVSISSEEFIQPSVYNKEIYKLIKNLIMLKNNIIGNFYGDFNFDGSFQLIGYNYDIDFSRLNVENINDYIIHNNESVSYYVLNRTLRRIYSLQTRLLELVTIATDELIPQPATNNILVIN